MKFSHQLKFNSVADWKDHYVSYANLKKIIYDIARLEQLQNQDRHSLEYEDGREPLLVPVGSGRLSDVGSAVQAKEDELWHEMDRELADIIAFYMKKEAETLSKLEALDLEVHSLERAMTRAPRSLSLDLAEEGQQPGPWAGREQAAPRSPPDQLAGSAGRVEGYEAAQHASSEGGAGGGKVAHEGAADVAAGAGAGLLLRAGSVAPKQQRVRFWAELGMRRGGRDLRFARDVMRIRFHDLYTSLNDLIEYLSLNREGFRKLIKKHDKLTSTCLKEAYWPDFERRYPMKRKEELERHLDRLIELYAVMFAGGDTRKARDLLLKTLREHIKVERNTVWRDMVALERRTVAATVGAASGVARLSRYKAYSERLGLLAALLVFAALLWAPVYEEKEKSNCLAILVLASMLWATEAIPLFATAMLIPVLVVMLRVLVDHGRPAGAQRLTPQEAAPLIFHAMFSQVIMLLLGGFTIAAALSKHFIAKQMAVAVLSRVGRKPHNVLLASMFVAIFASMWISNVAAPVLCFSLVQPILRTLDVNTPFAKSLVMGIALASNIGGMTSPISSPQNIFAIERMSMDGNPPSWLSWFFVALPVAIISNFICWAAILLVYQPWHKTSEVRPIKPSSDPVTWTQVYVIFVSLATVGLWCGNVALQKYTGEMGVVAVLPMVAFFGFGVLNKDDFNGFLWNVVMLAMGGSALGEAVKSSGLLLTIAQGIQEMVDGLNLWTVTIIFCACVLVCTTFISHTVGAMVILPIVQSVGESMPGQPHPKLLVMSAALMCSGAMGLPVSGFPNMNAVSLEDSTGQTYVGALDFIKVGVPSSILAYAVIITVGYSLMLIIGF
ncbi:hypothetical protein QJQ45_029250 [Haematococcus lacustris]|nr:hypothetical protein QJQ45_029250 [Haematococcus lacustris]